MANTEGHYAQPDHDPDSKEVAIGDVHEIVGSSEINQQIATAKRYPRSINAFLHRAKDLITLNAEVARQCYYVLPGRRGGDGKAIEGPSARFAEIILACWGNTRSAAKVVDVADEYVTAEGIFYDLEMNNAIRFETRRGIVTKNGERYSADMINVTGNAGCSIAIRNAILKGIPKAFWSGLYETARVVAGGDTKTLSSGRANMLDAFKKLNVAPEQVFALVGVKGIEDITTDNLVYLHGVITAISEGDASVDQIFGGGEKGRMSTGPSTGAKPKNEFERPAATAAAQTQTATNTAAPNKQHEDLNKRREDMLAVFKKFNVTPEEICHHLDVRTPSDITADNLGYLAVIYVDLRDGKASAGQIFGRVPMDAEEKSQPAEREPGDDSHEIDAEEEPPLQRGVRLLALCKQPDDVAELSATIMEEITDVAEMRAWAKACAERTQAVSQSAKPAAKKSGK